MSTRPYITTFCGGFDKNLSYLIWDADSREAALVDAATEPAPIRDVILANNLQLRYILITHFHGDHTYALPGWERHFPEAGIIGHKQPVSISSSTYKGLPHGAGIELGRLEIQMLETPGHSPDSVCWHIPEAKLIFTGDTVFIGRTGRALARGADLRQLYSSVYGKILSLPGRTRVYPGHDYGTAQTATISDLKREFPFFQCRDESEFRSVMADFEAGMNDRDR